MTGRTQRGGPRLIGLLCASALAVAGCAREEPYLAPAFAFLPSFKGNEARGVPVLAADTAWWEGYRDPTLNNLVARALSQNLDLEIARERVIEARAGVGAVPSDARVNPSGSLRYEDGSDVDGETTAEAALGFSWLLDPWGSRFHRTRAARARAEAAEAEVAAARLLVLLRLSEAYIDLRYQERLLTIRQQEVGSRRETLGLTRTLLEQGSGTRLDVLRAEARLAESESAIPDIRAAIAAQTYRIAVLLGTTPGTLPLARGHGQPAPRMSPQIGIPADLLRNRPDIFVDERLYYAAVADTGAARADLYPKLSLGGAITLSAVDGDDAASYFLGPSLTLPALPTSDRRAVVTARESAARQAHTAWKSTVLEAILEVETALKRYAAATASVRAAERTVALYRDAAALTRELVLQDDATIRELLDAEESVSDANLILAAARRDQALAYAQLNVALGAGHGREVAGETVALK